MITLERILRILNDEKYYAEISMYESDDEDYLSCYEKGYKIKMKEGGTIKIEKIVYSTTQYSIELFVPNNSKPIEYWIFNNKTNIHLDDNNFITFKTIKEAFDTVNCIYKKIKDAEKYNYSKYFPE